MYKVGLLLHLYQPPTQYDRVTREITETCYLPLVSLLEEFPHVHLSLNINGSLTEQWEKLDYINLIDRISRLSQRGQIELVSSAKYHPLLAKIPADEISRQVRLNYQTNYRLFGSSFAPLGFFPPELSYTFHVGRVLESLDFQWVLLEDTAFPEKVLERKHDLMYNIKGTKLRCFFRDRLVSLGIAFGGIKNVCDLKSCLDLDGGGKEGYTILAMDGETFGHHHPELFDFLREVFSSDCFSWKYLSEISHNYSFCQEVDIRPATWGRMVLDRQGKRIFPRWNNPNNVIHQLQWELFYLAIQSLSFCDEDNGSCLRSRNFLDQGLHSDQFFWAAGDPCWHADMVYRGASLLVESIRLNNFCPLDIRKRSEEILGEIERVSGQLFEEKIILGN